MPPRHHFVTVDGLELHYNEWGDPDAPPVLCVHGLSRNGRDFDFLAERIADEFRVLCPDMPGRGLSEWADDPDQQYTAEYMTQLLVGFVEALDLDEFRYLGTSMGGTLGMALAAGPLADRITHFVVNDVGPGPADDEAADEGIDRIIEYLTNPPTYDRLSDLEAYFRDVYDTFNGLSDAEWRRFTLNSARQTDDGQFTPNYDVDIVEPLLLAEPEVDPWTLWDAIEAELFVYRGTDSDILSDATFEQMLDRKPDAESLVVDCGHCPMLNTAAQVDPLREFLAA